MKRIAIVAALLFIAASTFAQTGKSIYNTYSDEKDVSAVYISPSMFKMMKNIPTMDIEDGDLNLTPIIKSLDGMYVIDSENESINARLREDSEKLIKSKNMELLMEAKDGDERVRIFVSEKDGYIMSFILFAYEKDECTLVCLDGKIKREDLEKAIETAQKEDKKD